MRIHWIVWTVVVSAAWMLLSPVTAEAGERRYWERVSGGVADGSTSIDLDGIGLPSSYGTVVGSGNLGPVDGWVILEVDALSAGPSDACEAGFFELPFVNGTGARRFRRGDLIYLQDETGTICANFGTGETTSSTKGRFTGGTGRFVDAGGEYKTEGTGKILMSDGVSSFLVFTFRVDGTIITGNED